MCGRCSWCNLLFTTWSTLDDIIEKFKWLYGSVESFDTLMQDFYQIVQGKSESVQTFVLWLERSLKAIKQQHPHTMTEEEGVKHLKDSLFHGLKPDICNALHYLCDTSNLQYSQLVMAARKAKPETPGSDVSEARAKSAVVDEIDSKSEGTNFDPSSEAITQQIAYLMSVITNQNNQGITMGIWFVGDVEVLDMGGGNVQHLDQTIISLLNQKLLALSQNQPGGVTIIRQLREGWGTYEITVPQS